MYVFIVLHILLLASAGNSVRVATCKFEKPSSEEATVLGNVTLKESLVEVINLPVRI
jgi:hypothetical protein